MPPKTKASKAAKMHKVMGEYAEGALRSSSGAQVTSRKQAVAIALAESGQARKKKKAKR